MAFLLNWMLGSFGITWQGVCWTFGFLRLGGLLLGYTFWFLRSCTALVLFVCIASVRWFYFSLYTSFSQVALNKKHKYEFFLFIHFLSHDAEVDLFVLDLIFVK